MMQIHRKLVFFSAFLFFFITAFATGEDLTFLVNSDYMPFSYEVNGRVEGFVVELIDLITVELGEPVQVESMSFNQAYERLQTKGQYGMPTLVFTPERKSLFQWVGPVAITHTYLYASPSVSRKVFSLEDAKKVAAVGVVRGYYSQQILEKEGFTNLRVFENEKALLQSVITGEVELAPFDSIVLTHLLAKSPPVDSGLTATALLDLNMIFLGFSLDVPIQAVERWQTGLDKLKESGAFATLYRKWLPAQFVPGKYTWLTEEYPPITYLGEDGKPTGFVTEIVREMLKRNQLSEECILLPWAIAYELALNLPNVLLFSIDQTPQRKPLFEWIGPVGQNTAYLYARADSNRILQDLQMAKTVASIATTKNWWTEQLLVNQGFTNLRTSLNPSDNVHQLMNREVELAIFTDLTVGSLVRDAGYSFEDIRPLLQVQSNEFYIAASKGTNLQWVSQLQKTLDQMKQDGGFTSIVHGFIPDLFISPELLEPSMR